jgi:hypothetical protein
VEDARWWAGRGCGSAAARAAGEGETNERSKDRCRQGGAVRGGAFKTPAGPRPRRRNLNDSPGVVRALVFVPHPTISHRARCACTRATQISLKRDGVLGGSYVSVAPDLLGGGREWDKVLDRTWCRGGLRLPGARNVAASERR